MLNVKLSKGLAWETVHHMQCALSKILGTAAEWGYIDANPVRLTRLPRRLRSRQKAVLTPEQLRSLLTRLPEPTRSLVFLLTLTGLRVGEMLALRWRNVDLGASWLRVEETEFDRNSSGNGAGIVGTLVERNHSAGVPAFADRRSPIRCEETGSSTYWTHVGPKFGISKVRASKIC